MAQTILITGATSGIGKATTELFAKHGFRIIIAGRRKERLESIEKQLIKDYNIECHHLCFDIRNNQAVEEAISSLPKSWENIDILLNNAGLASGYDEIHEGRLDDWEIMIDTNVKGLLYISRIISKRMVQNKHGHIINIASTAGKEVYPKGNVYCATKHAVDALTKAMRLDLHKYGIRVSQVAPGHVEQTEFAMVRFHGDSEKAKIYEDFTPVNSGDIANIIYFIATQPPHVNIQDILVMGTQQASSNFINRSGRK